MATTFVPAFNATVICELPHGHDGPHEGHIGRVTPSDAVSPHETFIQSHHWPNEEPTS